MNNDTHYIKAGWMIDGTGMPTQKDVLLTVQNAMIIDISSFKRDDFPDPSIITDLSHCTILPPLVDSHVHLALSSSTDPEVRRSQLSAPYADRRPRIAEHIHQLFSCGVLAIRDGGDLLAHVSRYATESTTGGNRKDSVILKTTTQAWHQEGRYGSFLAKSPDEEESLAAAATKDLESVDHIKLINSGLNSTTEFGKETAAQFSFEEIEDLVDRIGKKNKKLMVHANGHSPVQEAVDAGCHSIEHGFFMGEENLKRMADKQTFWVPTAVSMKSLLDNWESGRLVGNRDVISNTLDSLLEQMSKAKAHGVRLALGTDAGCPGIVHGESVIEELQLFMEAGYSLEEAIQCASSNGAALLDVDTIGTIAKGRPATFIVAQATPAMLPRKLSHLETICLDGKMDKAYFISYEVAKATPSATLPDHI